MKIGSNHIKRIIVKLPEWGYCSRGWKPPLVMLSIALLLILSAFRIEEVYAQSTAIYYFNGYNPAQAWPIDPGYMVDGDIATEARTNWDTPSDVTQLNNTNTCPGTNLGPITKVEMRALIDVYGADGYVYITPVFTGGNGTTRVFQETYRSWTSWFDITSDPNAPSPWTWADVVNLDSLVRGVDPASHDERCYQVEIRVSYHALLTFNSKYVVTSSTPVTSTSTTRANDTQATQTFTLATSQTVLAIYNAFNNNGSTEVATGKQIAIRVDSTDYAYTYNSPYAANGANGATTFWIGTLAAGSHTITGRFASNTAGSTVTIDERVLLILIFDGDAFSYIDNGTARTTTSTALTNDLSATQAFTPSGACKALILYNVGNTSGSTEDQNGKYAAINLGGTDYSQLIKSPNSNNRADNVFTLHYAALTAGSYTAQGRFASRFGSTVTISRRQLGVLLFADTTLADYVTSDASVNTTLLYPQNDGQALISRTTTDSRELLVVAAGTEDYQTSSVTGMAYGIQIDTNDRTKSRTSPFNYSQNSNNASTAWAETLAKGSHTVRGRYGNNTGTSSVIVTSRRIVALWFPALAFQYRRPITLNYSQRGSSCTSIPAGLSDFPVLVSYSDATLRTVGEGGHVQNANGYDIVFRAADGVTQLDHEVESYDGVTGTLIAWVRIPSLFAGDTNTTIYMYYGNSAITSPTQNPAGVWDTNYKAVWHLSNDNFNDSTSNGNNGTDNGTTDVAGEIANGRNFDDTSSQYITTPSTDLKTANNMTISCWFKADKTDFAHHLVWEGQSTDGNGWGESWLVPEMHISLGNYLTPGPGTSDVLSFFLGDDDVGRVPGGPIQISTAFSDTVNWHHVVATVSNLSTSPSGTLYLDGASVGSATGTTAHTGRGAWDTSFQMGKPGMAERYYAGNLDEVRISSVARDACWIGTEYNNQYGPGTFVTVNGEVAAGPTAAKLTSFTATQFSDGVLLRWHTGYEVDNLGFHVYREENGQLVRLTPEPVAGSALLAGSRTPLTAGHHYHWWDTSLSPQSSSLGTLKYWLKDIDLNGTETMHGPVTPVLSRESIPEKFRPELLSEVGWRLQERYHHYWKVQDLKDKLRQKPSETRHQRSANRPQHSVPGTRHLKLSPQSSSLDTMTQQYLAGRPAVKLLIREEGWYRVTQPELVVGGLSSKVNPKYLQLYVEGQEQPIRIIGKRDGVFGPGDAIEFYGMGLDTPSTDTRVYWLVEGPRPGQRIHEFKGYSGSLGSLSLSSFPYTVEVKDRWIYLPAIKNGEEENFFGAVVYGSGVDQLLNLQHLDPAPSGDAMLEVALQGATSGTHRVKVLLNNEAVGEVAFEGQAKGLLQVEVPQSPLLEGDNLVSFVPLGGEMDVSLVDTIRLTYWHTYTADDNALKFTANGGGHLSLSGFSDPKIRVIDITDSNDVIEVFGNVESQKGSYAVSFRVPGSEQRTLLALGEERVKSPEGITPNQPSSWHQSRDGYDFVMITHRDFHDSVQPLKKLRESQGLKVALIDVEDLYDEFSFGNKSPKAIKDFLASAKSNWRKVPRFVLLVGDASFDPKDYFSLGDFDFVPTKLIDTVYMETASDDWFVDSNNDGLPEIAIGRLPVQTADEAAIVVSKIVGYERSSKKNEALLVADRVDNSDDFNFEGASEEIRALLPSSLVVRKIYRSRFSSDSQVNGVLLGAINQGPLLVNFIGHGSIEIWRGNLLTSDDADTLINGYRLPFFVNMTCLNGYFQDPYSETLGEALLKAPQGGAVAVWASSGLTEPDKQAVMNKELIKLLFGREYLTLGEATAKAKASVFDQDVRKTWTLFGDPTTKLK